METEEKVTSTGTAQKEPEQCGLCLRPILDRRHYCSRTKLHLCKNEDCRKFRRPKSAYCGECK